MKPRIQDRVVCLSLFLVCVAGCGAASDMAGPVDASSVADLVLPLPDLAAPLPAVYLNHMYAVLDAETAAALPATPYLSDTLAAAQKRTNSGGGRTWTGFYVYGRETYLELFAPGQLVGPPGYCAVGFGVEARGGVDAIGAVEAEAGRAFTISDQTLSISNGMTIPFFHLGTHTTDPFSQAPWHEWVMEYAPEFMAYATGDPGHDPAEISRKTAQARFYRSDLLLENVRALRFVMPGAQRDDFAMAAAAYGWPVRREGEAAIAEGPGATITVAADANHRGLAEVRLTLNRAVAMSQSVPVGSRSTLLVGPGSEAVWTFTPIDVP